MNQKRKPYDKKLLDCKKRLDDCEVKIKSINEVNFLEAICQVFFKDKDLIFLYNEFDEIESQVRGSVDAFSRRPSEDTDYEYYLGEMSSTILRINNLRNELSKKDPQKYIKRFTQTKGVGLE